MSIYICPACQSEYDDDYGFCHKCGGRLVEKEKNNPALNLGDANAISGGVSINQVEEYIHARNSLSFNNC